MKTSYAHDFVLLLDDMVMLILNVVKLRLLPMTFIL